MSKQIKLKKLLKEHTLSLAGGVVSKPAFHNTMSLTNLVKEKYGTTESEPKISSEQILSKIQEFGNLGKSIYKSGDLKETSKTLSDIANAARVHTLRETESWFDKVTVNRNMKELTNLSKSFGKIAQESQALQQRLGGLYEDMGHILGRYYEIDDNGDSQEDEKIKAGLEEPKGHDIKEGDYEEFFQKAMKKFGIKSPAELDDEKKKEFFNFVDKNYKGKNEED